MFRRSLAHIGNVPAASLTVEQVEDYLLRRPTNANFNKDRTELMRLFSWAHRRLMVPNNPVYLVEKLSVDRAQKVIPSPQAMAKILVAAGGDHPMLLVLFHTIRHFVASYLFDKKKVSLPVISKLLRHKSLQTTERYLQAIDPRFRETMRLLEGNVLSLLNEMEIEDQGIRRFGP